MFEELYAGANQIRTLLIPFAFLLCVIGIGETGWRAGSDPHALLGAILKCVLIIGLIVAYPDIMRAGQEAFIGMRNEFTGAQDAKLVQLLRSRIENQPSDSWMELGKIVPAVIGYFFQGIGRFTLIILRFFQEFSIAGLIAVSPLLIGFLFFSYTQSIGVQFGLTSVTVLLWHVAICLVDITIKAISDALFMPITAGGIAMVGTHLIVVNNWMLFPFIMAFASIITLFFYLSVPFVAGAIMRGASGTSAALQGGIQTTLQGAGMAVGAAFTAAGAAATFGGSAAAQSAAQGGASVANSLGRIANDLAGGDAGGGGSHEASELPLPPPVPSEGDKASTPNPANPAMVAHQTAANAFAVVDHERGTVSHHRGQISTPQAVQAAFNSHTAKAQALPPDSPLANLPHKSS